MKTSACSMPASTSASTSSAVPTVKRPPASSHVSTRSLSSCSCESGSWSSTETSWPASSACLATAEPTRPAPTIRISMSGRLALRTLVGSASAPGGGRTGRPRRLAAGAVRITRHSALRSTYFVASPTKLSSGPPDPPSSAPPRTRDGSSAASTIASTPRRFASLTIPCPARRARTIAVCTWTPSYSSPTALARRSASCARLIWASGRRASIGSAIGTSKTQIASITAPSSSSSSQTVAGEAAGGLDDVVVERLAEDRHEDRAELLRVVLARASAPSPAPSRA